MTGSGNDFVLFDGRSVDGTLVTQPEAIRAICNRHNGIGADGLVVLEPVALGADARIRYFNSDGTAADLCGNATLCSTALTALLGLGDPAGMRLITDAGLIASRLGPHGPEIDVAPVRDVRDVVPIELAPGERRIGFAVAGVPHLVVLVNEVRAVDVEGRGAVLRRHVAVGPGGANVNFASQDMEGRWHYRTYERGVEGETLACGTGSIATAILLERWALASSPTTIWTRSEKPLTVSVRREANVNAGYLPSLQGEGRVVFRGTIGSLA